MKYVEDFLQYYVEQVGVNNKNKQILESINNQCKRKIALTDRQHALVVKLLLEASIENFLGTEDTREPIRQIDRSKYIKIVDTAEVYGENVYESYKQNWKWIKIRFPFSKKDISKIEKLKSLIHGKQYVHRKGSHEHYIALVGANLKHAIDTFNNFEIDKDLNKYYKQIDDILGNRENIVNNLKSNIDTTLSEIMQVDRQRQFGFTNLKYNCHGIQDTIVNRKDPDVLINPAVSINEIVEQIVNLDRFPIIVCIDQGNEYSQLTEFYNAIKYVVDDCEQSVLFRVDKSDNENAILNNFIKDNKLNNWVDKNTKVVYIKKKKLPKLLLEDTGFIPRTLYTKTSTPATSHVSLYCNFYCDLRIYHDTHIGMIRTHSTSWRHFG
jgi:hypothetical protein